MSTNRPRSRGEQSQWIPRVTALLAAFAAVATLRAVGQPRPRADGEERRAPALVVLLVVDQMRADRVDVLQREWQFGLKRLITRGAWFDHAAYPYLITATCAGHATIATGAFPHRHGMIQNDWLARDVGRTTRCTEDAGVTNLSYGAPVTTGDSPRHLLLPTLADRLRTARGGRVVTLSLKHRSAITLAGHAADAATWMPDDLSAWVTSPAFTPTLVPAVKTFLDAHPIEAESAGRPWDRVLAPARYRFADEGEGEQPPAGWGRTFPHVFATAQDGDTRTFRTQWGRSPMIDAFLGQFAASLVEQMALGQGDRTDFLGIGFSSADRVGHSFGPDSQEAEDTFARLDQTIGVLLDRLDALVGPERYVLALTSDHGVAPIPEQAARGGRDAGRVDVAAIRLEIEAQLQTTFGPGQYVARLSEDEVSLYFAPGVYTRLQAAPAVLGSILRSIERAPGVEAALRGDELVGAERSTEPVRRAAALSYFAGRSGDILIALKPGWVAGPNATAHINTDPANQRVPIIFMGPGFKPGRYSQPVTPADVAPTLAALCGLDMPDAEGHPLRAALTAQ